MVTNSAGMATLGLKNPMKKNDTEGWKGECEHGWASG